MKVVEVVVTTQVTSNLVILSIQNGSSLSNSVVVFQPPFYSRDTGEMYDNILNKPLRLRTNISVAGRGILEQVGAVCVFL